MSLTEDLSRWRRSIAEMRKIPGKHGPEVVNKAVQKIVIGSGGSSGLVHLVKKATAAQIRADLNKPGPDGTPLLIHLATISLKRKGLGGVNAKAWKLLVKAEARRILNARIRSRGAHVAGWLAALRKLQKAARITGASTASGAQVQPRGSASRSIARVANSSSLIAGLINMVEESAKVTSPAIISEAIRSATADNLVYLERKFGTAIRGVVAGTSG